MAAFGAVLGPVALAWGLQHTSGTSASLMLTLEALFTAMLLLLAGGVALVLDQGRGGGTQLWGMLVVLVATAAWGTDNTLSRALAERDPGQVVLGKAAIGAAATAVLAPVFGEPLPSLAAAVVLFAVGASGYGLSLRFSLLAQRAFGAPLHLMESHGHEHDHEALAHEHAHDHDDGHHDHTHEAATENGAFVGSHSHPHVHAPRRHAHAHVPDAHHRHAH